MIESDQESQTDDTCNIAGKCVDNGNGVHFKFYFTLKTGNVSRGLYWKSFPNCDVNLTHLPRMFHFCTPFSFQYSFTFSEGIKMEHRREIN